MSVNKSDILCWFLLPASCVSSLALSPFLSGLRFCLNTLANRAGCLIHFHVSAGIRRRRISQNISISLPVTVLWKLVDFFRGAGRMWRCVMSHCCILIASLDFKPHRFEIHLKCHWFGKTLFYQPKKKKKVHLVNFSAAEARSCWAAKGCSEES